MKSNKKGQEKNEYWSGLTSEPPQNMMVAVQLFAGVRGSMMDAALAGYTLTAPGMSSSAVSLFVL